ncbi:MAG: DUF5017 domain-containing protein [Tannerella sp.]|jgi:hypothetical protein|nr:DUF5017 domain-containing protein [Tannerella sp.]
MKRTVLLCIVPFFLAACTEELDKSVEFDAAVQPAQSHTVDAGGVIHATPGTQIVFDFSGDPDFISFSYEIFKATSPSLRFDSQLSWSADADRTLQLFISDAFAGLSRTDAPADRAAIAGHAWVNLSPQCTFPTVQNGKERSVVTLDDFRGRTATIAFRYKTVNGAAIQPMWTVSDLQLVSTLIATGIEQSAVSASSMDFTPFDMLNLSPGDAPYLSGTAGGVWDTSTPALLRIRQTFAGRDLNEDWLFSRPLEIPAGITTHSAGIAVKNTTASVSSYTHTFTETGEYVLTFIATNYNFKAHSELRKTFRMIINN